MSGLSEKIADDVLRASGSALKHYSLNGSRERIIAAALVADDLLEALELALKYWADRQQRYRNRAPIWVQKARAAIAKATGATS